MSDKAEPLTDESVGYMLSAFLEYLRTMQETPNQVAVITGPNLLGVISLVESTVNELATIDSLTEQLEAARRENAELRNNITCVWCGGTFGTKNMVDSDASKITDHMLVCDKSEVVKVIATLYEALAHAVQRDHPDTEWCDGCRRARAALGRGKP